MLFFTRDRGRGHAIPDIAMVRELERLRPDIRVRFVSYGTGALTFAAHGIPCIDLQLPDQNSVAATTVLAGRVMAALAPDLVVAQGADEHLLKRRVSDRLDITILGADWQIDRLMVASDLVITKTNRMTVIELASLGIRTLSLSYGLNPVDERCVAGLEGNETIAIGALTPGRLRKALARPEPAAVRFRGRSCAAELSLML